MEAQRSSLQESRAEALGLHDEVARLREQLEQRLRRSDEDSDALRRLTAKIADMAATQAELEATLDNSGAHVICAVRCSLRLTSQV